MQADSKIHYTSMLEIRTIDQTNVRLKQKAASSYETDDPSALLRGYAPVKARLLFKQLNAFDGL